MGGEQALISLDLSMLIQVINFLVLFYVVRKLYGKKIGPILEKRKEIITGKLAEAEKERSEATKSLSEADHLKKEARKRANDIVIKAERIADERKEKIIHEANVSREKMLSAAETDIEKMRQKASKELEREISGLAVNMAEKIIKENIGKTEDKIIDNFIDEIGE